MKVDLVGSSTPSGWLFNADLFATFFPALWFWRDLLGFFSPRIEKFFGLGSTLWVLAVFYDGLFHKTRFLVFSFRVESPLFICCVSTFWQAGSFHGRFLFFFFVIVTTGNFFSPVKAGFTKPPP